MTAPNHKIVRLPSVLATEDGNESRDWLLYKARDFRLEALQTSPDSFGSSYDEELLFPLKETQARLSNRFATHYVALPSHGISEDMALHELDWKGTLVGHGPEFKSSAERVERSFNLWNKSDERGKPNRHSVLEETVGAKSLHYQYNGLFVKPSARGHGLGVALLETAMSDAKRYAEEIGVQEIAFDVVVFSKNTAAMKVYEKVGFVEVSRQMHQPRPRKGYIQEETEIVLLKCTVLLRNFV